MYPPKFIVWNPDPQCDVSILGGEASGGVIRSEGRGFTNGISAPIRETPRALAASPPRGHNKETAACSPEEGSHQTLLAPCSQTSSLQHCEKVPSSISYPICGILSQQPELTKTGREGAGVKS